MPETAQLLIESETKHEAFEAVRADIVFPDALDCATRFHEMVVDKQIDFTIASDQTEQADSRILPWRAKDLLSEINTDVIPDGSTYVQMIDAVPEEQRASLIDQLNTMAEKATFDVALARKQFWWISEGESSGNREPLTPWRSETPLYHVAQLETETGSMTVNDFSGKIDIETVYTKLGKVIKEFAARGIDTSKFISTFNILPADNVRFYIPDATRKRLGDDDGTMITCGDATKSKRLFTINEEMILREERDYKPAREGFSVGDSWEDFFAHELTHFLNGGLADQDGDYSFAKELGWRKRDDVFTDDYGNLIEKPDTLFGKNITDDLGNDVFISRHTMPELLTAVGSGFDENGAEIKPPSQYAHESSHEDIAESGAAFIGEKEGLDKHRKDIMGQLALHYTNIEHGTNVEVTIKRIPPAEYDPFDAVPRKLVCLIG